MAITYISGGNVYFSIDTFPEYGRLARLNLDQLNSGARIEIDENKKNPKDFVLWFTKSKFDNQAMRWPSPWGIGYPGWHIECSAMSMYYLGESFDIHCGGIDHVSVHHTNEIAQSEAATNKPWVKYWVHGEFLINETGKMSKSKGEFLTIPFLKDKGYDPLDYRYFCLLGHYRSQLVFSWTSLDAARSGRRNLMKLVSALSKENEKSVAEITDQKSLSYLQEFEQHINTDLHIPQALATLWTLLKDENVSDEDKRALCSHMDTIFALDLLKEEKEVKIPEQIYALLEKRAQAKIEKKYQEADEVRAIIEEMGYVIKDTKDGPIITKIV